MSTTIKPDGKVSQKKCDEWLKIAESMLTKKRCTQKSKPFAMAPRRNHLGNVIYEPGKPRKVKKETTDDLAAQSTSYINEHFPPMEVDVQPINIDIHNDEFLTEILAELEKFQYPVKKPSVSWQERRYKDLCNWSEMRQATFDSFLKSERIPPPCNLCFAESAVLRCEECLPHCYMCAHCDKIQHSENILHDRKWYNSGYLQPISPQILFEKVNDEFELKVTEKLCPVITPSSCSQCHELTKLCISHHKQCILVNLKGRFDVYLPKFQCSNCEHIQETTLEVLIESGLFPSHANITSGMYVFSNDLLLQFDLLRKQAPGVSIRSYISLFQEFSEDRGRSSTISQTAFADALREWRYLKYAMHCLEETDFFTCPSCHDHMFSLHCDGNRKLYRYSNTRQTNNINYYGPVFIENDDVVDSFISKVTETKVLDDGDQCGHSHWKAMKSSSKTMAKQAETGLVMACCRHNILQKALNMFRGEIYAYPLYIQYSVGKGVKFICQDVICKYWPWMKKVVDKIDAPDYKVMMESKPFLSVMHAKAHSWTCQIEYGGRFQTGSGLTTGEEMEQTNAYMSRAGFVTKTMTKGGRDEELTQFAMAWNDKKIKRLDKMLINRYLKVEKQLPETEKKFTNILQKHAVSEKTVRLWKIELLDLAKEKNITDETMSETAKLYLLHLQLNEAKRFQGCTEAVDNELLPDRELYLSLKKKLQNMTILRKSYEDLKKRLSTSCSEEILLTEGREELAAKTLDSLQKKIEMGAQSIKQKEYDLYKVQDSGKKRSRIRQKLRTERVAQKKLMEQYNNLISVFPSQSRSQLLQSMVDNELWPWIVSGEINYAAKKEAVDILNLMDRLKEEKPIVLKEMQSFCLFLIKKIKILQKPVCIIDESGRFIPSKISHEEVVSVRKRKCDELKIKLKKCTEMFSDCVCSQQFDYDVPEENDDIEDDFEDDEDEYSFDYNDEADDC